MKPENVEKMTELTGKYPAYFAFLILCVKYDGMLTDKQLINLLGPERAIQISVDLLKGGEEITKVLEEVRLSEGDPELTSKEEEVVKNLLSKLK